MNDTLENVLECAKKHFAGLKSCIRTVGDHRVVSIEGRNGETARIGQLPDGRFYWQLTGRYGFIAWNSHGMTTASKCVESLACQHI